MKRYIFSMAWLSFLFLAALAQAEEPEIIEEGDGYKKLSISRSDFEGGGVPSGGKDGYEALVIDEDNEDEIVAIETLEGLRSAGLPEWKEEELLNELGYPTWNDVPADAWDEPIDQIIVNLTVLAELQLLWEEEADRLMQEELANLPDGGEAIFGIDIFLKKARDTVCKAKYENKTFSKNINLDDIKKTQKKSFNNGGFTGELDTFAGLNGTAKFKMTARAKVRCGIFTDIKEKTLAVELVSDINGELELDGEFSYENKKKLFQGKIDIWSQSYSYNIYGIELNFKLDLNLNYGVDILAEAEGRVEASYKISGTADMSWDCTSSSCIQKKRDVKLGFETPTLEESKALAYEAKAKIEVKPYVDLNFGIDFDAFYGFIDVASAKIGIVAAAPFTFYGYYGNMCSDSQGDGTNELVKGAVLDVNGIIHAYLKFKVGSKEYKDDIEISILNFDTVRIPITYYYSDDKKVHALRTNLYFKSLLNDTPHLYDPVVTNLEFTKLDTGSYQTRLHLDRRVCVPTPDKLVFDVDWGDGGPRSTGSAQTFYKTWSQTQAQYKIKVRVIKDVQGRVINSPWLTIQQKGVETPKPFGNFPKINDYELDEPINNSGAVNWLKKTGSTPSANTGPTGASSGDYYLYFETSTGYAFNSGDVAVLNLEDIYPKGVSLSFDYHMFGQNIGKLALQVRKSGAWSEVWSVSGQQQEKQSSPWLSKVIGLESLGNSHEPFGIRFVATAVGGFLGDIAIDNIRFSRPKPIVTNTYFDGTYYYVEWLPADNALDYTQFVIGNGVDGKGKPKNTSLYKRNSGASDRESPTLGKYLYQYYYFGEICNSFGWGTFNLAAQIWPNGDGTHAVGSKNNEFQIDCAQSAYVRTIQDLGTAIYVEWENLSGYSFYRQYLIGTNVQTSERVYFNRVDAGANDRGDYRYKYYSKQEVCAVFGKGTFEIEAQIWPGDDSHLAGGKKLDRALVCN